jgi:hypothetical protein
LNTGGSLESPTKKIVLHYQPQFWDVKTSKPPIPQQWHNKGIVRRAAKALLTTGTKINLARYLREMRYAGAAITSHFHANFACAILQNLAPEARTWFDPSMGWGGRLIASKILGVEYEGCDPQPETYNGLLKISDFIGSEATLHNIKAQDYRFGKGFDVCFTSPPFFNKEKYGGEEQSYFEFPRLDQWIVEFLCPLIDELLINCRKVIFHVDNSILKSLSKLYGFDQYPLYLQKNPGSKESAEFIIVFNK